MVQKGIFAFFIFCVLFLKEAIAAPTVYIYAGPGVSEKCLLQTEYTMQLFLAPHYLIKQILPKQIIHDDWEKETALLIIPGGADIPYMRALKGRGNQKIRSYVENGGAFLGICAGGYYSGNFVDFAKGTPMEVFGERELSFFPGIVRGPILAPYEYRNDSGARAAKIIWRAPFAFEENSQFTLYYNGGGYFVDADKKNNTTVLACYDREGEEAAMIECQVGLGKAILTCVHFECDPTFLDEDDKYLKELIPDLASANLERIQLTKQLLERLGLGCN